MPRKPSIQAPWPPTAPKGFPLTINARGYIKRIAGKVRWICGRVSPEEALAIYHRKASALSRGKTPLKVAIKPKPAAPIAATVHWMLSKYLVDRKGDMGRDELKPHTYAQIRLSCQRIDDIMGDVRCDAVVPDMIREIYGRLSEAVSVDGAKRAIGHFSTACQHAADAGWVAPMKLGALGQFTTRPKTRTVKWRIFTPAEVAKILAEIEHRMKSRPNDGRIGHCWHQLKAGVLLALNGGLGSKECSELTCNVVDLAGGWIDHARGKTGKQHKVPLWPETLEALRFVMGLRSAPEDFVFINRSGGAWNYSEARAESGKMKVASDDNFKARFNEVLRGCGLKIGGESFYKLRHTHQTIADEAGDPHATYILAGLQLPGVKSHYVRVSDERLKAVVDHVRAVLLKPDQS